MKKIILVPSIIFFLIAFTGVMAQNRNDYKVGSSGVIVNVPDIAAEKSPALEMIEIVHKRKAKPDNQGKPSNSPKQDSCYGFISGKARLIESENIYINYSGSGMSEDAVLDAVASSTLTWDRETSIDIYGTIASDLTANFDYYADGKNEISFGSYTDSNTIAVTRMWGYFSGKPTSRYITEFDILFNTNYTWGDAAANSLLMDFQNIATHELGHTLGLDDIYTDSCSAVTMYGYSFEGDTEKRSLDVPDVMGLLELYGA